MQLVNVDYIKYNEGIGKLMIKIIEWDTITASNWVNVIPSNNEVKLLVGQYPALELAIKDIESYIANNKCEPDFWSMEKKSRTDAELKSILGNFKLLYNFCAGDYNAGL